MAMRSRDRIVICPDCNGTGGEVVEEYSGRMGYGEAIMTERWQPCETCDGTKFITRADSMALAIGRAWAVAA